MSKDAPKLTRKQRKMERERIAEEKRAELLQNLTNFPEYKLPKLADSDRALAEEPIWMKKGKRIIADLSSALQEDAEDQKQQTLAAASADSYGPAVDVETKSAYALDSLKLDNRLMEVLMKEGYTSWFPVQTTVIPAVIRGNIQKRDIAVCAPTGSGKTLSYVLPICHVCDWLLYFGDISGDDNEKVTRLLLKSTRCSFIILIDERCSMNDIVSNEEIGNLLILHIMNLLFLISIFLFHRMISIFNFFPFFGYRYYVNTEADPPIIYEL